MTAIAASFSTYRLMVDGTLRAQIDVEPRDKDAALAIFNKPGAAVAIAGLVPDHQQPTAPEPAKGGELSKWVAMRGDDDEFAVFIKKQAVELLSRAAVTAALVRALCEVTSRSEIDNDPAARERFNERIRGPWIKRTQTEESMT